MKIIFPISFILVSAYGYGQTDKLCKHNGDTIEVQIKEITAGVIKYSLPKETLTRSIGKYSVAKIIYSNGNQEKISDFISLESYSDFERVAVLSNTEETLGLVDKGIVKGKSGGTGLQTPDAQNKISLTKIKKASAKRHAPFVLIEETVTAGRYGQSIRKGHAYAYK